MQQSIYLHSKAPHVFTCQISIQIKLQLHPHFARRQFLSCNIAIMCAFHARTDKCNSRTRTNAFQMCTQSPILCVQLQLHFQACTHNYAFYVCIKYAFNPRTQSRFNFLNVHFNSSRIHADSRTVQAELPKTGSKEEALMPNALQLSEVKILHVQIS